MAIKDTVENLINTYGVDCVLKKKSSGGIYNPDTDTFDANVEIVINTKCIESKLSYKEMNDSSLQNTMRKVMVITDESIDTSYSLDGQNITKVTKSNVKGETVVTTIYVGVN